MIEGRALKYEQSDDVSTDLIWPGKYTYVQIPPAEMRRYAFEGFDPDFRTKAESHSILVVGRNFGCGSSREQAAECLKHSGIDAVIAESFSRLFYRNAINLGLPVIESREIVAATGNGDAVKIDLENGLVTVAGSRFSVPPYPRQILDLIDHGGLINLLRSRR